MSGRILSTVHRLSERPADAAEAVSSGENDRQMGIVLWDSHSRRRSAADESPFPEACDDVDLAMPIEEEPVLGVEGLGPWVLLEDPQVRGSCACLLYTSPSPRD